jgi:general L-amino acid transport system substrate-binding protein
MRTKWLILTTAFSVINLPFIAAQSQPSATFNKQTGELYLPKVELFSNEGEPRSCVEAKMQLTPSSEPLRFTLQPGYTITNCENSILTRVQQRGKLLCAGRDDLPGFNNYDNQGRPAGFDFDLCQAVASAVLESGITERINIPNESREAVLKPSTGQVDILSRNTTWTTGRGAKWGNFTWIMFYDGQGFMVRGASGITTLDDLKNRSICVAANTTSESNLVDRGFKKVVKADESTQAMNMYLEGACEAVSADSSALAIGRARASVPEEHLILNIPPISKEPLGPVVPYGDDKWLAIVNTVLFALINAEELGITQANVNEMIATSKDPQIRRLLGVEGSFGQETLGLSADAMARVIRKVGNYGEIYERHFGWGKLHIPRNLNQLTSRGGSLYAPPLR